MATNKTTETTTSVPAFIKKVEPETKRDDCLLIIEIMKSVTKLDPKMWGPAIVGFGSYHYKYDSGHEGDAPLIAFSPRKAEIVLYLGAAFEQREELLNKFGKYKAKGGCMYIKKIADVDVAILKKLITNSYKHSKSIHK